MIAIDPAPQHLECQVNLGIRPHKKRRARGKYRLCCMTHACIVHRKEKLVKLIVFFYAKSRVIMTFFAFTKHRYLQGSTEKAREKRQVGYLVEAWWLIMLYCRVCKSECFAANSFSYCSLRLSGRCNGYNRRVF